MANGNIHLEDLKEIEEFFDFVLENPVFFREGINLDESQRELVRKQDTWIVSYVNKIPSKWKKWIGKCFLNPNLADYNGVQSKVWFKTEKDLFQTREGRAPTPLELIADAEKHENMTRFKLCYTLLYPWNATLLLDEYNSPVLREKVDLFLALASRIDPSDRPYPYFDIICKNSLLEDHKR
jgi:hypothetical protein